MENLKYNSLITLLLSISIISLIAAFVNSESFFNWAFHRHQNVWSWWARPLLMIPFCYFAYKKNRNGILLVVLAILSSMFWFPAPANPDPQMIEFLEMEKVHLTSGWTGEKIITVLAILAFFGGITAALWQGSIKFGIGIAIAGAVLKVIWSFYASPEYGILALPFALGGAVLLILMAFAYRRWGKLPR